MTSSCLKCQICSGSSVSVSSGPHTPMAFPKELCCRKYDLMAESQQPLVLCGPVCNWFCLTCSTDSLIPVGIPRDLVKVLGVESQGDSKAGAFTRAFLNSHMRQDSRLDPRTLLTHKAVILDFCRPKKDKSKRKSKRAKGLNARQKRAMKVFHLKPEHQRYELFLPLHELWRQYVIDLCNGLTPTCSPQFVQQKLLKADFHGAILTVVRSKCPSYVGATGILVQEFKHIFKIITKEDKLKVIPKRNSVFAVEINGFVSHIYGSKFEHRASERSAKKFKARGTIDL